MIRALIIALGISAPAEAGDGLRLVAGLAKRDFRPGEPILLNCTLKNDSGEDFIYYPDFFYRNHRLIVRGDGGLEPALTDIGEEIKELAARRAGKNRFFTVKSGSQFQGLGGQFPRNDLAKIYRLKPGKYSVTVEYKKGIVITSNTVHFRLREATP